MLQQQLYSSVEVVVGLYLCEGVSVQLEGTRVNCSHMFNSSSVRLVHGRM